MRIPSRTVILFPQKLTKKSLAALLDSTFLKAFGGPEIIENLCREAAEFGFASVAVNGCEVARGARRC